ncbi:hypothetical protein HDU93_007863 [Gonapodya sp. JEL0774]|nr:hypothetical protein HDU93_007863 [Gonapodya sp. JEL0774]
MGVTGRRSEVGKRGEEFVIEVEMGRAFKPGLKVYERFKEGLERCLDGKYGMVGVAWDQGTSSSRTKSVPFTPSRSVPLDVRHIQLPGVAVPNLDHTFYHPEKLDAEWRYRAASVHEWIGMVFTGSDRVRAFDTPDPFIAVMSPPTPSSPQEGHLFEIDGLVPVAVAMRVLDVLCSFPSTIPLVALAVQGHQSSPTSFAGSEREPNGGRTGSHVAAVIEGGEGDGRSTSAECFSSPRDLRFFMAEQPPLRDSIKVIARFRPLSKKEQDEGGLLCAKFLSDDSVQIETQSSSREPIVFSSDLVLPPTTPQATVFNHAALPIVQDVMRGYNGTLFAYGQTGAGKTYTMMGPDIDGSERGLVPRIVESVFGTIESSPDWMEFTVKCSYMEIYMEKIRDLLNPSSDSLPIHEEKGRGVYVKGLLECYVGEIGEVYEIMRRGMTNRQTAETNMNEASSRSHSIFLLTITQRNIQTGANKSGRLYLVDLAGSEKVSKTGASGQVLEEAKKINKSLSALGNVINALTDGKNRAHVNIEMSVAELKRVVKGMKEELEQLRGYSTALEGEVHIWRGGGNVPLEKQLPSREKVKDMLAGLQNVSQNPSSPSSIAPPRPSSAASVTTAATIRPTTPTFLDDANLSMSSLPTLPSEADDISDTRENELADQLADKERELETVRRELEELKTRTANTTPEISETENVNGDGENVEEMRGYIEKLEYELKERDILIDGLREAKTEMEDEIASLLRDNAELEEALDRQSKAVDPSEKDQRRLEKMIRVVAELSPGADQVSLEVREHQIREALQRLGTLTDSEGSTQLPSATPLLDSGGMPAQPSIEIDTHTSAVTPKSSANGTSAQNGSTHSSEVSAQLVILKSLLESSQAEKVALQQRILEMEAKFEKLEADYEDLLHNSIVDEEEKVASDDVVAELKVKIEAQYNVKRDQLQSELESTRRELQKKEAELAEANDLIATRGKELEDMRNMLSEASKHADVAKALDLAKREEEIERIKKQMAQQLVEFDGMKKRLMQNLQQRVDRVIELEVSLDETREQYNKALGSGATREQQRKLAFLERNLEQLTTVQQKLVESNQNLKKELTMADRKLAARNERIQTLEILLADTQTKFKDQQHRFEAELTSLRQKLQEATLAAQANPQPPREGWLWSHSKIAKPLRGGKQAVGVS